MDIKQQVEAALLSGYSNNDLQKMVKLFLTDGYSNELLIKQLNELHMEFMTTGKEKEDDLILEILDNLEGWCSPHMKL